MSNLYWLDQIQPEQHPLVGDKALHLSDLVQRGYAVVPGFVVSATLFREFLATINWLEPLFADLAHSTLYLDVENSRQLQAIARRIRQTIAIAPLPAAWTEQLAIAVQQLATLMPTSADPALILRSSLVLRSATPKFSSTIAPEAASLLESQICWADPEALAIGLKQAWAELFRARNLLYWQRSGLALPQINLAVLIQPLGPAIASGSLHLQHGELEVRATPGLSMTIERGEVIPDVYQIDINQNCVKTQQIQTKTLVYQLRDRQTGSAPALLSVGPVTSSPLQPYLLSERQDQSTLEAPYLAQLGQLGQQLAQDFDLPLHLEWVLCPHLATGSRLLLTHLTLAPSPLVALEGQQAAVGQPRSRPLISIANQPPLAVGLPAAPGQVIAQAIVVISGQPLPPLSAQMILVAANFTPDWLPWLRQVAGVIAEEGGMTSHGAIVARELGIPAVVGVAGSTHKISTGDWLLLDGDRGQVHRVEAPSRARSYPSQVALPAHPIMPPTATQVTQTQVMVSLSQPDALAQVASLPVAGIGLLRSELMALAFLDQQHPTQWLQTGRRAELVKRWTTQISQFAQALAPRPVFYRTLDWRLHEFPTGLGATVADPLAMLGLRGTFSYQLNPDLFDVELAALSQVYAAGYTNLRLILPFVRTVEEFSFCRQRVEQKGLLEIPNFELWIMAEVPSVLFLLPEYVAAGVQGIAIGTNDLTQLLLGVDRDQSLMASAFNEAHPAVVRAILQLIDTAKTLGIPCSICGQAPVHHPELIPQFVKAGVTAISVSLEAVPATLQAIAAAESTSFAVRQSDRNRLDDKPPSPR